MEGSNPYRSGTNVAPSAAGGTPAGGGGGSLLFTATSTTSAAAVAELIDPRLKAIFAEHFTPWRATTAAHVAAYGGASARHATIASAGGVTTTLRSGYSSVGSGLPASTIAASTVRASAQDSLRAAYVARATSRLSLLREQRFQQADRYRATPPLAADDSAARRGAAGGPPSFLTGRSSSSQAAAGGAFDARSMPSPGLERSGAWDREDSSSGQDDPLFEVHEAALFPALVLAAPATPISSVFVAEAALLHYATHVWEPPSGAGGGDASAQQQQGDAISEASVSASYDAHHHPHDYDGTPSTGGGGRSAHFFPSQGHSDATMSAHGATHGEPFATGGTSMESFTAAGGGGDGPAGSSTSGKGAAAAAEFAPLLSYLRSHLRSLLFHRQFELALVVLRALFIWPVVSFTTRAVFIHNVIFSAFLPRMAAAADTILLFPGGGTSTASPSTVSGGGGGLSGGGIQSMGASAAAQGGMSGGAASSSAPGSASGGPIGTSPYVITVGYIAFVEEVAQLWATVIASSMAIAASTATMHAIIRDALANAIEVLNVGTEQEGGQATVAETLIALAVIRAVVRRARLQLSVYMDEILLGFWNPLRDANRAVREFAAAVFRDVVSWVVQFDAMIDARGTFAGHKIDDAVAKCLNLLLCGADHHAHGAALALRVILMDPIRYTSTNSSSQTQATTNPTANTSIPGSSHRPPPTPSGSINAAAPSPSSSAGFAPPKRALSHEQFMQVCTLLVQSSGSGGGGNLMTPTRYLTLTLLPALAAFDPETFQRHFLADACRTLLVVASDASGRSTADSAGGGGGGASSTPPLPSTSGGSASMSSAAMGKSTADRGQVLMTICDLVSVVGYDTAFAIAVQPALVPLRQLLRIPRGPNGTPIPVTFHTPNRPRIDIVIGCLVKLLKLCPPASRAPLVATHVRKCLNDAFSCEREGAVRFLFEFAADMFIELATLQRDLVEPIEVALLTSARGICAEAHRFTTLALLPATGLLPANPAAVSGQQAPGGIPAISPSEISFVAKAAEVPTRGGFPSAPSMGSLFGPPGGDDQDGSGSERSFAHDETVSNGGSSFSSAPTTPRSGADRSSSATSMYGGDPTHLRTQSPYTVNSTDSAILASQHMPAVMATCIAVLEMLRDFPFSNPLLLLYFFERFGAPLLHHGDVLVRWHAVKTGLKSIQKVIVVGSGPASTFRFATGTQTAEQQRASQSTSARAAGLLARSLTTLASQLGGPRVLPTEVHAAASAAHLCIGTIVDKLLFAAIGDRVGAVRYSILAGLASMPSLISTMCNQRAVSLLTCALQDDYVSNRALALVLLSKLSPMLPATVHPPMRRFLKSTLSDTTAAVLGSGRQQHSLIHLLQPAFASILSAGNPNGSSSSSSATIGSSAAANGGAAATVSSSAAGGGPTGCGALTASSCVCQVPQALYFSIMPRHSRAADSQLFLLTILVRSLNRYVTLYLPRLLVTLATVLSSYARDASGDDLADDVYFYASRGTTAASVVYGGGASAYVGFDGDSPLNGGMGRRGILPRRSTTRASSSTLIATSSTSHSQQTLSSPPGGGHYSFAFGPKARAAALNLVRVLADEATDTEVAQCFRIFVSLSARMVIAADDCAVVASAVVTLHRLLSRGGAAGFRDYLLSLHPSFLRSLHRALALQMLSDAAKLTAVKLVGVVSLAHSITTVGLGVSGGRWGTQAAGQGGGASAGPAAWDGGALLVALSPSEPFATTKQVAAGSADPGGSFLDSETQATWPLAGAGSHATRQPSFLDSSRSSSNMSLLLTAALAGHAQTAAAASGASRRRRPSTAVAIAPTGLPPPAALPIDDQTVTAAAADYTAFVLHMLIPLLGEPNGPVVHFRAIATAAKVMRVAGRACDAQHQAVLSHVGARLVDALLHLLPRSLQHRLAIYRFLAENILTLDKFLDAFIVETVLSSVVVYLQVSANVNEMLTALCDVFLALLRTTWLKGKHLRDLMSNIVALMYHRLLSIVDHLNPLALTASDSRDVLVGLLQCIGAAVPSLSDAVVSMLVAPVGALAVNVVIPVAARREAMGTLFKLVDATVDLPALLTTVTEPCLSILRTCAVADDRHCGSSSSAVGRGGGAAGAAFPPSLPFTAVGSRRLQIPAPPASVSPASTAAAVTPMSLTVSDGPDPFAGSTLFALGFRWSHALLAAQRVFNGVETQMSVLSASFQLPQVVPSFAGLQDTLSSIEMEGIAILCYLPTRLGAAQRRVAEPFFRNTLSVLQRRLRRSWLGPGIIGFYLDCLSGAHIMPTHPYYALLRTTTATQLSGATPNEAATSKRVATMGDPTSATDSATVTLQEFFSEQQLARRLVSTTPSNSAPQQRRLSTISDGPAGAPILWGKTQPIPVVPWHASASASGASISDSAAATMLDRVVAKAKSPSSGLTTTFVMDGSYVTAATGGGGGERRRRHPQHHDGGGPRRRPSDPPTSDITTTTTQPPRFRLLPDIPGALSDGDEDDPSSSLAGGVGSTSFLHLAASSDIGASGEWNPVATTAQNRRGTLAPPEGGGPLASGTHPTNEEEDDEEEEEATGVDTADERNAKIMRRLLSKDGEAFVDEYDDEAAGPLEPPPTGHDGFPSQHAEQRGPHSAPHRHGAPPVISVAAAPYPGLTATAGDSVLRAEEAPPARLMADIAVPGIPPLALDGTFLPQMFVSPPSFQNLRDADNEDEDQSVSRPDVRPPGQLFLSASNARPLPPPTTFSPPAAFSTMNVPSFVPSGHVGGAALTLSTISSAPAMLRMATVSPPLASPMGGGMSRLIGGSSGGVTMVAPPALSSRIMASGGLSVTPLATTAASPSQPLRPAAAWFQHALCNEEKTWWSWLDSVTSDLLDHCRSLPALVACRELLADHRPTLLYSFPHIFVAATIQPSMLESAEDMVAEFNALCKVSCGTVAPTNASSSVARMPFDIKHVLARTADRCYASRAAYSFKWTLSQEVIAKLAVAAGSLALGLQHAEQVAAKNVQQPSPFQRPLLAPSCDETSCLAPPPPPPPPRTQANSLPQWQLLQTAATVGGSGGHANAYVPASSSPLPMVISTPSSPLPLSSWTASGTLPTLLVDLIPTYVAFCVPVPDVLARPLLDEARSCTYQLTTWQQNARRGVNPTTATLASDRQVTTTPPLVPRSVDTTYLVNMALLLEGCGRPGVAVQLLVTALRSLIVTPAATTPATDGLMMQPPNHSVGGASSSSFSPRTPTVQPPAPFPLALVVALVRTLNSADRYQEALAVAEWASIRSIHAWGGGGGMGATTLPPLPQRGVAASMMTASSSSESFGHPTAPRLQFNVSPQPMSQGGIIATTTPRAWDDTLMQQAQRASLALGHWSSPLVTVAGRGDGSPMKGDGGYPLWSQQVTSSVRVSGGIVQSLCLAVKCVAEGNSAEARQHIAVGRRHALLLTPAMYSEDLRRAFTISLCVQGFSELEEGLSSKADPNNAQSRRFLRLLDDRISSSITSLEQMADGRTIRSMFRPYATQPRLALQLAAGHMRQSDVVGALEALRPVYERVAFCLTERRRNPRAFAGGGDGGGGASSMPPLTAADRSAVLQYLSYLRLQFPIATCGHQATTTLTVAVSNGGGIDSGGALRSLSPLRFVSPSAAEQQSAALSELRRFDRLLFEYMMESLVVSWPMTADVEGEAEAGASQRPQPSGPAMSSVTAAVVSWSTTASEVHQALDRRVSSFRAGVYMLRSKLRVLEALWCLDAMPSLNGRIAPPQHPKRIPSPMTPTKAASGTTPIIVVPDADLEQRQKHEEPNDRVNSDLLMHSFYTMRSAYQLCKCRQSRSVVLFFVLRVANGMAAHAELEDRRVECLMSVAKLAIDCVTADASFDGIDGLEGEPLFPGGHMHVHALLLTLCHVLHQLYVAKPIVTMPTTTAPATVAPLDGSGGAGRDEEAAVSPPVAAPTAPRQVTFVNANRTSDQPAATRTASASNLHRGSPAGGAVAATSTTTALVAGNSTAAVLAMRRLVDAVPVALWVRLVPVLLTMMEAHHPIADHILANVARVFPGVIAREFVAHSDKPIVASFIRSLSNGSAAVASPSWAGAAIVPPATPVVNQRHVVTGSNLWSPASDSATSSPPAASFRQSQLHSASSQPRLGAAQSPPPDLARPNLASASTHASPLSIALARAAAFKQLMLARRGLQVDVSSQRLPLPTDFHAHMASSELFYLQPQAASRVSSPAVPSSGGSSVTSPLYDAETFHKLGSDKRFPSSTSSSSSSAPSAASQAAAYDIIGDLLDAPCIVTLKVSLSASGGTLLQHIRERQQRLQRQRERQRLRRGNSATRRRDTLPQRSRYGATAQVHKERSDDDDDEDEDDSDDVESDADAFDEEENHRAIRRHAARHEGADEGAGLSRSDDSDSSLAASPQRTTDRPFFAATPPTTPNAASLHRRGDTTTLEPFLATPIVRPKRSPMGLLGVGESHRRDSLESTPGRTAPFSSVDESPNAPFAIPTDGFGGGSSPFGGGLSRHPAIGQHAAGPSANCADAMYFVVDCTVTDGTRQRFELSVFQGATSAAIARRMHRRASIGALYLSRLADVLCATASPAAMCFLDDAIGGLDVSFTTGTSSQPFIAQQLRPLALVPIAIHLGVSALEASAAQIGANGVFPFVSEGQPPPRRASTAPQMSPGISVFTTDHAAAATSSMFTTAGFSMLPGPTMNMSSHREAASAASRRRQHVAAVFLLTPMPADTVASLHMLATGKRSRLFAARAHHMDAHASVAEGQSAIMQAAGRQAVSSWSTQHSGVPSWSRRGSDAAAFGLQTPTLQSHRGGSLRIATTIATDVMNDQLFLPRPTALPRSPAPHASSSLAATNFRQSPQPAASKVPPGHHSSSSAAAGLSHAKGRTGMHQIVDAAVPMPTRLLLLRQYWTTHPGDELAKALSALAEDAASWLRSRNTFSHSLALWSSIQLVSGSAVCASRGPDTMLVDVTTGIITMTDAGSLAPSQGLASIPLGIAMELLAAVTQPTAGGPSSCPPPPLETHLSRGGLPHDDDTRGGGPTAAPSEPLPSPLLSSSRRHAAGAASHHPTVVVSGGAAVASTHFIDDSLSCGSAEHQRGLSSLRVRFRLTRLLTGALELGSPFGTYAHAFAASVAVLQTRKHWLTLDTDLAAYLCYAADGVPLLGLRSILMGCVNRSASGGVAGGAASTPPPPTSRRLSMCGGGGGSGDYLTTRCPSGPSSRTILRSHLCHPSVGLTLASHHWHRQLSLIPTQRCRRRPAAVTPSLLETPLPPVSQWMPSTPALPIVASNTVLSSMARSTDDASSPTSDETQLPAGGPTRTVSRVESAVDVALSSSSSTSSNGQSSSTKQPPHDPRMMGGHHHSGGGVHTHGKQEERGRAHEPPPREVDGSPVLTTTTLVGAVVPTQRGQQIGQRIAVTGEAADSPTSDSITSVAPAAPSAVPLGNYEGATASTAAAQPDVDGNVLGSQTADSSPHSISTTSIGSSFGLGGTFPPVLPPANGTPPPHESGGVAAPLPPATKGGGGEDPHPLASPLAQQLQTEHRVPTVDAAIDTTASSLSAAALQQEPEVEPLTAIVGSGTTAAAASPAGTATSAARRQRATRLTLLPTDAESVAIVLSTPDAQQDKQRLLAAQQRKAVVTLQRWARGHIVRARRGLLRGADLTAHVRQLIVAATSDVNLLSMPGLGRHLAYWAPQW